MGKTGCEPGPGGAEGISRAASSSTNSRLVGAEPSVCGWELAGEPVVL